MMCMNQCDYPSDDGGPCRCAQDAINSRPPARETAESRLRQTLFVVEATSFETHMLWQEHASGSTNRQKIFKPRRWEQVNPGWSVTVGELDGRPVCVSMMWNRVDGHLVMFWEPTSQVVDHIQIDAWLGKHFDGKWDNGTRDATCNAMNFHHCLNAIDDINKKD